MYSKIYRYIVIVIQDQQKPVHGALAEVSAILTYAFVEFNPSATASLSPSQADKMSPGRRSDWRTKVAAKASVSDQQRCCIVIQDQQNEGMGLSRLSSLRSCPMLSSSSILRERHCAKWEGSTAGYEFLQQHNFWYNNTHHHFLPNTV